MSPAVVHPVFVSLAIFRGRQESTDLGVCRNAQTKQDKLFVFTYSWICYYFIRFKTHPGLWRRLRSINSVRPFIRQEMPCSLPYKCFDSQIWINQDHYTQGLTCFTRLLVVHVSFNFEIQMSWHVSRRKEIKLNMEFFLLDISLLPVYKFLI